MRRESERIDAYLRRRAIQEECDRRHRIKHIMGYAMPTPDLETWRMS